MKRYIETSRLLLRPFRREDRAVPAKEVGYLLHRNHRRQGLASEAVEAVAEACFADGNRLVLAEVYASNTGSMRMLEKLGFVREGITRCAVQHCAYGLMDMVNYYKEKSE